MNHAIHYLLPAHTVVRFHSCDTLMDCDNLPYSPWESWSVVENYNSEKKMKEHRFYQSGHRSLVVITAFRYMKCFSITQNPDRQTGKWMNDTLWCNEGSHSAFSVALTGKLYAVIKTVLTVLQLLNVNIWRRNKSNATFVLGCRRKMGLLNILYISWWFKFHHKHPLKKLCLRKDKLLLY